MTDEKVIPLLLGLILLPQRKIQAKIAAKTESRTETFPRSSAITATKKTTMPVIAPSQKTSDSLSNLNVGN